MEPKAPGARCSECPLQNRPFVPGHGPSTARIVIVGEAPGAQEVEQGRPFVGKSGQLLTRILRQVGVDRDAVHITNACLCRPEDNKTPNRKAIRACRDRLIHEIRQRSPHAVIAMGGPAAQAVLDVPDGITKLRVGGVKGTSDLPDVEVIPTFHPAFALRVPDALPSILDDLRRMDSSNVEIGWEPTQYQVHSSVEPALEALREQLHSHELALDIENDPSPDGFWRPTKPEWLCIGIAHRPGHAVVYDRTVVEHPRFQSFLAAALANRDRRWAFQNGKYDVQYLWSFADEARVDEDSMLMHYTVDERKGTHDLEQLSTKYLGAPNYKTEARSYKKDDDPMSMLPPEVLHRYNATDVDCTLRLMEPLRKEMASDGVERVYRDLLIPASDVLARVERHGIRVDLAHLDRLEEGLAAQEEEIFQQVSTDWGINPRSWKQLLEKFAEEGYELSSTNKEILTDIRDLPGVSSSAAPSIAEAVLRYRGVHKLLGTYVRGNRKLVVDGRIHPSFLLHGTETGRLSSRRPNSQNQPREHGIRDIFTADEGFTLVSGDYSQAELRLAAIFSKDPYLSEAFSEGRNVYDETARAFYGEKYKGKKQDSERYTLIKTVVLAALYGESPAHLARRLHITIKEARGIIETFHGRSPALRRWQRELSREIITRQHLTSYFGRKRRFWLITDDNRHDVLKEGWNFPLQSTASDLTLRALIKLEPMLRGRATPLVTVHDSLTWQTKLEDLDDVATIIRETMSDTPFDLPMPVDISVGQSWGSMVPA